jgi:invasion protein IalB
MIVRRPILAVLALTGLGAHLPEAAQAEPQQILKSRDWAAYRHGQGRDRSCFAVTEEIATRRPPGQEAHLLVTNWPQDGIKAEVSLEAGAPLRKDGTISVAVDGTTFELFAAGARAFVADPRVELRLLEAMRKGQQLTANATLADGKAVKATFSLRGFTQTVQAVTLCK